MNLARHAAVLWRFRRITAVGLLLGVFLAVLASYQITTSGLVPRAPPTYTSQSQLLVTQAGFPEGRVVLPPAPAIGSTTEDAKIDPNRLEFADPGRFMALADLYTKLIVSDEVRTRLPHPVADSQIVASPLPAVSGAPILPIIQLDTLAGSPAAAQKLNEDLATALRGLLEERQEKNDISRAQSVQIATLREPSPGTLAAAPSKMASILAFLLCLIGTIAVTHLLENIRNRREASAMDDFEQWDVDDAIASNGTRADRVTDGQLAAAYASVEWDAPVTPRRTE
jgi:hypothetical protein